MDWIDIAVGIPLAIIFLMAMGCIKMMLGRVMLSIVRNEPL